MAAQLENSTLDFRLGAVSTNFYRAGVPGAAAGANNAELCDFVTTGTAFTNCTFLNTASNRGDERGFQSLKRVLVDRWLPASAEVDEARQRDNPIKLLTSGAERKLDGSLPFYTGGRWRFVDRHFELLDDAGTMLLRFETRPQPAAEAGMLALEQHFFEAVTQYIDRP